MIHNIIWDVDGTLFDTYPAITRSIQAALIDFGHNASIEWIEDMAKISLSHCISTLAAQFHIREEEIGQKFNDHYDKVLPGEQPPFPGVVEICAYICSTGGRNLIVTHRGRAGTVELLEANKMAHLFTGCITRDDGFAKKPDPAAFNAAVDRFGIKREETITVGDREIDITAGQGAGLFSCYFGENGSAADLVIHNFSGLFAYLLAERENV